MSIGTIIKEKVNALPMDLQEDVLEYVEKLSANSRQIPNEQLEQEVAKRLLAKELISEVPEPLSDEEDADFDLIEVEGEPVSEMIIKERR
ncbi:hypothetical protein BH24ACI2_BH24ACI2_16390 [soil metagenome]